MTWLSILRAKHSQTTHEIWLRNIHSNAFCRPPIDIAAIGNGLNLNADCPRCVPHCRMLRANQHRSNFRLGQLPQQIQHLLGAAIQMRTQLNMGDAQGLQTTHRDRGCALIKRDLCQHPPQASFSAVTQSRVRLSAAPNFSISSST